MNKAIYQWGKGQQHTDTNNNSAENLEEEEDEVSSRYKLGNSQTLYETSLVITFNYLQSLNSENCDLTAMSKVVLILSKIHREYLKNSY